MLTSPPPPRSPAPPTAASVGSSGPIGRRRHPRSPRTSAPARARAPGTAPTPPRWCVASPLSRPRCTVAVVAWTPVGLDLERSGDAGQEREHASWLAAPGTRGPAASSSGATPPRHWPCNRRVRSATRGSTRSTRQRRRHDEHRGLVELHAAQHPQSAAHDGGHPLLLGVPTRRRAETLRDALPVLRPVSPPTSFALLRALQFLFPLRDSMTPSRWQRRATKVLGPSPPLSLMGWSTPTPRPIAFAHP